MGEQDFSDLRDVRDTENGATDTAAETSTGSAEGDADSAKDGE